MFPLKQYCCCCFCIGRSTDCYRRTDVKCDGLPAIKSPRRPHTHTHNNTTQHHTDRQTERVNTMSEVKVELGLTVTPSVNQRPLISCFTNSLTGIRESQLQRHLPRQTFPFYSFCAPAQSRLSRGSFPGECCFSLFVTEGGGM